MPSENQSGSSAGSPKLMPSSSSTVKISETVFLIVYFLFVVVKTWFLTRVYSVMTESNAGWPFIAAMHCFR